MDGRRHCRSRDRLSELPANVFELILICLPLKEAIKTSVLSRELRERWTFLPHIVFDYPLLNNLVDGYHVILRQRGTITKFHLDITYLSKDPVRFVALSDWVELVSKRCLENFKLFYCFSKPLFKLPRSFYSCQNLRRLELQLCVFIPPPNFHGFTGLVCLVLECVKIAPDVLDSLLRKCTLLESLTLNLEFIGFEINAPRLKYLRVGGNLEYICLRAPLLATLEVEIDVFELKRHEYPSRRGFEIHGNLNMLELFLSCCEFGFLKSMKVPPSCFSQVKRMVLDHHLFMCGFEEIVFLLKRAPNLELLGIKELYDFDAKQEVNEQAARKEVRRWFDEETSKETFLRRLNRIDISTEFLNDVKELIKCLLERAPALQSIHVGVLPLTTIIRVRSLESVKDELLSYTRASPAAEIYVYERDAEW